MRARSSRPLSRPLNQHHAGDAAVGLRAQPLRTHRRCRGQRQPVRQIEVVRGRRRRRCARRGAARVREHRCLGASLSSAAARCRSGGGAQSESALQPPIRPCARKTVSSPTRRCSARSSAALSAALTRKYGRTGPAHQPLHLPLLLQQLRRPELQLAHIVARLQLDDAGAHAGSEQPRHPPGGGAVAGAAAGASTPASQRRGRPAASCRDPFPPAPGTSRPR